MELKSKPYAYTVLAVDDDAAILDLIGRNLTARGLRVITTTDPEKVPALLILSDIAMPGLDGLTLLKTLKASPATRDIPLILLTSSRAAEDIEDGLNSGAEAYLVKPIDWESAWPKIQAILMRS